MLLTKGDGGCYSLLNDNVYFYIYKYSMIVLF